MTQQNTACKNKYEHRTDVLKETAVKRSSLVISNDYAMGWAVRGRVFRQNAQTGYRGPPNVLVNGYWGLFLRG
jgi:hypothetical protein